MTREKERRNEPKQQPTRLATKETSSQNLQTKKTWNNPPDLDTPSSICSMRGLDGQEAIVFEPEGEAV